MPTEQTFVHVFTHAEWLSCHRVQLELTRSRVRALVWIWYLPRLVTYHWPRWPSGHLQPAARHTESIMVVPMLIGSEIATRHSKSLGLETESGMAVSAPADDCITGRAGWRVIEDWQVCTNSKNSRHATWLVPIIFVYRWLPWLAVRR